MDVPEGWQALGNGAEIDREQSAGRTRVRFAATEPISTYLFAFAAGKFNVEQAERSPRPLRRRSARSSIGCRRNIPNAFRRIILSSADDLFRAAGKR